MKKMSRSLILGIVACVGILLGCAGAKVMEQRVKLTRADLNKKEPLLVQVIDADSATFTGDKSDDAKRVAEEKAIIKQTLVGEVVTRLQKEGFNAKRYAKGEKGAVLSGKVTLFEHGSGAARMFVGMGAGSSNLHVSVKIEKAGKTISDFDVVATSGGRGGLTAMSSFLQAHVEDAGEKIADYLDKQVQ